MLQNNRHRTAITLFLAALLVFTLSAVASAATNYDEALKRWSKFQEYKDNMGGRFRVRATLYTGDYIENLVQSEAEKNLWTASELEDYKYNFLKGLNLDERIAIHLELEELGATAHMAPFNEMIYLWIGSKKYAPVDFDQRFNLPLQGKRDGMVFFPKYDEKTGESLFSKDLSLRMVMVAAVSPVLGNTEVRYTWDIKAGDMDFASASSAADRLEIDRLLRRMEKLSGEKADLEAQLEGKNREIDAVRKRIEELRGH